MIIEMRTYRTKPGLRSRFLEIFRSKSIPAHAEIGMKILGPFLSVEDAYTLFFMRGFPDLASREPMKAQFYEGELWKRDWKACCYRCWKSMKLSWWKIPMAWCIGKAIDPRAET